MKTAKWDHGKPTRFAAEASADLEDARASYRATDARVASERMRLRAELDEVPREVEDVGQTHPHHTRPNRPTSFLFLGFQKGGTCGGIPKMHNNSREAPESLKESTCCRCKH